MKQLTGNITITNQKIKVTAKQTEQILPSFKLENRINQQTIQTAQKSLQKPVHSEHRIQTTDFRQATQRLQVDRVFFKLTNTKLHQKHLQIPRTDLTTKRNIVTTRKISIKERLPKNIPSNPLWTNRHNVWRHTTAGYQKAQTRLVNLLSNTPDAINHFSATSTKANWGASTKASYWTAWLGAKKTMHLEITAEDRQLQKQLDASSKAATPTITNYLTPTLLNEPLLKDGPLNLKIAILLTFVASQRISDILQLHSENVKQDGDFLMITLTKGKVIDRIGPYTIFFPAHSQTAKAMLELQKTRGNKYLFSEENSTTERHTLGESIRVLLKSVNTTLNQPAIRHGGARQMGLLAIPQETIRTFTKHATESMLNRYMQHGQFNRHLALTQADIVNQMEDSIHNATLERKKHYDSNTSPISSHRAKPKEN